jgi:hypothetical protein
VAGGGGAACGATQGVVDTLPFPTRLGLGLDCAGVGSAAEVAGETAAVPQLVCRAAAEREERAVDDLSFSTLPAEVEVEADCEDAPAMGG